MCVAALAFDVQNSQSLPLTHTAAVADQVHVPDQVEVNEQLRDELPSSPETSGYIVSELLVEDTS